MSAFWAQVVSALVGAVATGGVKIFTAWLQRRAALPPAKQEEAE